MRRNRTFQIAVIVLMIAGFVALRYRRISESCLWFDEIFSVQAALQPWNSLLSFVALDLIHPPLFYVILKLWISVGGESSLWLRSLPIAFALLTIVPTILLVKELKQGFRQGIIVLLLLIFSGTFLKYSLEVRMYSMVGFLATISTWLFTRFLSRGVGLFPLLLVNVCLVYTHYFGWLVILSELIAILILDRKKTTRFLVTIGIVFLAFGPWAFAVLNAASEGRGLSQNIGWMSRPGIREIAGFVFNLVEPFYYQTGSSEPVSNFFITLPLLGILLATVLLTAIWWKDVGPDTRKTIGFLLILTAVPPILAFAVSWITPYSVWGTRHLMIVLVPFYVLVSVLVSTVTDKSVRLSVASIAILLFGIAGILQLDRDRPRYAWCELGPLTKDLSDTAIPIYAVEDLIAYHLWFEQRKQPAPLKVMKLDMVDGVREDTAYFLPRGFDDVGRVDLVSLTTNKFWLVHRSFKLSESEPPLRNLTVKGYRITSSKIANADGERVGLYLLER